MRNKLTSAPALLCFLSFFLLSSITITDLSAQMPKSRIHGTQGGWNASSKSDERLAEFLDFSFPKGYFRNVSHSMQGHGERQDNSDAVDMEPCSLKADMLQQMKIANGSAWIIDNTTLNMLNNDPQKLIKCTGSGDRVVFNLTGVHKFKHTLIVDHVLHFVSKSPEADDSSSGERNGGNFTCPDSGPFLIVKSVRFSASGFVIKNCTKSSGEGAIVIQSKSKVALESSIFSSNRNRSIFVDSNTNLKLKSCQFENNGNREIYGGAIRVLKNVSLSIISSAFYGNIAKEGGAICGYNDNKVTIINTNVAGNQARLGGAIWLVNRNVVTITNASFSGNNASDGGAIRLFNDNNLALINSSFSKNQAKRGGAIWIVDRNELTITNTSFWGNDASFGGAMWLQNINHVTIMSAMLIGNNASLDGGAILLQDTNHVTIISAMVSRNQALYNGGVIKLNNNNTLVVTNTTALRNQAKHDGIMYLYNHNELTITNTELSRNRIGSSGALWLFFYNNITITNTKLSRNNVTIDKGGAIHLYSHNNLTIMNTNLSRNQARLGGAIWLVNRNVVTITNASFSENNASDGGAIRLYSNNSVTIIKTNVIGNNAGQLGGAIDLDDNNNVTIINTNLTGNKARECGGAISLLDNNNVTIINTNVTGNNAGESGGAIDLVDNNNVTIINTNVTGNSVKGSGGAIYMGGNSNLALIHTNVIGNNAEWSGGAISLEDNNNVTIIKTNVVGNNASDGGAMRLLNINRLMIASATFSRNNARDNGGAINLGSFDILNVSNTLFLKNQANYDGGAMSLDNRNSLSLHHTTFSENYALRAGGAILSRRDNTLELSCTNFSRNNAAQDGGALRLYDINHLTLFDTTLSQNSAYQGGAIFSSADRVVSSADGVVSFIQSTFKKNRAKIGGCFYGERLSLKVQGCACQENLSSKNGGCFYIKSSKATFEGNKVLSNHANNSGGGIYAMEETLLRIHNSSLVSNSANHGGGVALVDNSTLFCVSCSFENNSAIQGGGLYVISNASQVLLAQLTMSIFRGNKASIYGGGMVVKTFGIKAYDCKNNLTPCDRIVLDGSSFINNSATFFGSSIMITKPDNVLVNCEARHAWTHDLIDKDMDLKMLSQSTLKAIDPKNLCESWEDGGRMNDTSKIVIGTFAHKFNLTTNSTHGLQIEGNHSIGFIFKNVQSGKPLPSIIITTLDAFGNTHAPFLMDGITLRLNSSEGPREQEVRCSLENEICTIDNLIVFVLRENYTIQFYSQSDGILEATSLKIIVRACIVDEESTSDGKICRECGDVSYNFNLSSSGKCFPCPENANCTTQYIKPKDGYWHKGPCHARVKRCIVEEVCKKKHRIETLNNFIRHFDNCTMNNTMLEKYSKAQCRKGHEGSLCGSCQTGYGFSSSFDCKKCGHVVISLLTLIGITCYLLFGTSITIKGVLPSRPTQHANEDVEAPLLPSNTSIVAATSSHQPSEAIGENNDPSSHTDNTQDTTSPSSRMEQLKHEIELARQKIIGVWKILLNFVQVASIAATMDIEWTDEVLDAMEKLQVFGAATINSISRPIDCLLSFASRDERVIWRTLFSVFVPCSVIAILATYWGYRAITVHGRDTSYFLKRLLLTTITTTYITYFDLTQVAVRVFDCVRVHNNIDPFSKSFSRSWVADTSIECYKTTHFVLIGIALLILVLVSIGFPLFCSFTLSAMRNELTTTSSWAHDTLSFLCGPFKEKFVYWECVTMIKKALLSIIVVFSYSLGKQAQGLLILMVLGFFLYLHMLSNPYDEAFNRLNYFEGGSLLTSCTIYTLVQFLNVDTLSEFGRHAVSVCLLVVASSFVCLLVYEVLNNVILLLRMTLESKNVPVPEHAKWFTILKIWYNNRGGLFAS